MLALALTATLTTVEPAPPAPDEHERPATEWFLEDPGCRPMSLDQELEFLRKNRLGYKGLAIGAGGLLVGGAAFFVTMVLAASDDGPAWLEVSTLTLFFAGVGTAIAGPVLQTSGTLGAAAILRRHGSRVPTYTALIGLGFTVATLWVGYPLGGILLASQSAINRKVFIQAYGYAPGHREPTFSVQLVPLGVRGGSGLALVGHW